MAAGLERPQRLMATRALQSAAPVTQIERLADPLRQRAHAPVPSRTRSVQHIAKPTGIGPQTPCNLCLNLHATHDNATARSCSVT